MPQDGDPLDPEVDSDRLEVVGEHVEGEVGGLAGRSSAASQVDVDEPEAIAELWRSLALVRLRADAAQDEARRPAAAGRIEQLGALDGEQSWLAPSLASALRPSRRLAASGRHEGQREGEDQDHDLPGLEPEPARVAAAPRDDSHPQRARGRAAATRRPSTTRGAGAGRAGSAAGSTQSAGTGCRQSSRQKSGAWSRRRQQERAAAGERRSQAGQERCQRRWRAAPAGRRRGRTPRTSAAPAAAPRGTRSSARSTPSDARAHAREGRGVELVRGVAGLVVPGVKGGERRVGDEQRGQARLEERQVVAVERDAERAHHGLVEPGDERVADAERRPGAAAAPSRLGAEQPGRRDHAARRAAAGRRRRSGGTTGVPPFHPHISMTNAATTLRASGPSSLR